LENYVVLQVENFSQTGTSRCINFVDKPIVSSLIWKLFFDGSKSNDVAATSCILVSPKGEKLCSHEDFNLIAQTTLLNMKH